MKTKKAEKQTPMASLSSRLIPLAAGLVSLIAIKYIASDLIAPILLAAMFAVLLMPIYYFYKKRGIAPNTSLILMIFTVIIGSLGVIFILQYAFGLIQESINMAVAKVQELTQTTSGLTKTASTVISPELVKELIGSIMASFSEVFLYFVIIPVLAVLFVSQIDSFSVQFKDKLSKSGPSMAKYKKFSESMKSYVIGRFKVNLATALMVTVSLMFFGVEYAVLWGILTLILCFIPYVGIFIAGAGPFLIVVASSGIVGGLLLIGLYLVITTITENFIDPLVQGKQNRLTTASLIIGFIFWSWLFGILGTIIAAPLTVMLKTILEDYKETQWIALLMVGDYSKTPTDTQSFKKRLSGVSNKVLRRKSK